MTNDPFNGLQIKAIRQLPRYHSVEISSGERMKRKLDKLYVFAIIAIGLLLLAISLPAAV